MLYVSYVVCVLCATQAMMGICQYIRSDSMMGIVTRMHAEPPNLLMKSLHAALLCCTDS